MLTQRDFGPLNAGNMGNAWMAAAAFERDRLARIQCPTNQTGVTQQVRRIAIDACKADITAHEARAAVCFKMAITDDAHAVAESYEFAHVEGAA